MIQVNPQKEAGWFDKSTRGFCAFSPAPFHYMERTASNRQMNARQKRWFLGIRILRSVK